MTEWKYIKTVDDLPIEWEEYIVFVRVEEEAKMMDIKDFVTTAEYDPEQKLWRINDNWYINPLLPLISENRDVKIITHWMKMPDVPKEE